jgi:hypothetical protein
LTVEEVFTSAGLSYCGPVPWGIQISERSTGVYVIARVENAALGCDECALPFTDQIPPKIVFDLGFERLRWLSSEPVVYVGATKDSLRKRVGSLYRHKIGDRSPHAGGQILKLLRCSLWVYWSPATHPMDSERAMLNAFKEQAGQVPFANADGERRQRRVTFSD